MVARFEWVFYVFGVFLVFTGLKLLLEKQQEIHPEQNPVLRLTRRFFPVTTGYESATFFLRRNGALMVTPLFLVLMMVESTDVLFAIDSIPAVLAITRDPFLVYTSNVFAILGLRSLYFLLAGAIRRFRYLRPGLSLVLIFVGVKMLAAEFYKIPVLLSLGIISSILLIAVVASLRSETRRA